MFQNINRTMASVVEVCPNNVRKKISIRIRLTSEPKQIHIKSFSCFSDPSIGPDRALGPHGEQRSGDNHDEAKRAAASPLWQTIPDLMR